MIKNKIKRKYYILVNMLLIFFLTFLFLQLYTKKTTKRINIIAEEYFQKQINNNLNDTVRDVMKKNNIEDILQIYRNNSGEILYVDYNLENSYELLDKVSQKIKINMAKGSYPNSGILLKVPFGIGYDNLFFANLGPKVTIKINYVDSILTNIYTKITNYGLNNALVEAYIKVAIDGQIITPVSNKKVSLDYDLLISSKVINGRVPDFYGNYLTTNSSIFDVPINN